MTLFNPQVGFFGRTYKGASLKLQANQETNELERLPSDSSAPNSPPPSGVKGGLEDWALFYTRAESRETKAVVEIIVLE